jgi:hypothetical protein
MDNRPSQLHDTMEARPIAASKMLLAMILCAVSVVAFFTYGQWLTLDDTSKRQLRAYVLFDDGRLFYSKGKLQLNVRVRNGGLTPALGLTRSLNHATIRRSERSEAAGNNPEFTDTGKFKVDILPGGVLEVTDGLDEFDNYSKDDLDEINNGERVFYISGMIKYRDIYERCHYSAFRAYAGKTDADAVRKLIIFENTSSGTEGRICNQLGKADFP